MKIRDLCRAQAQKFAFEFFPPKRQKDDDELFCRSQELRALGPTIISVAYGACGSTRRNTIDLVCRFQAELGMLGMAHLSCVGHSQTELRDVVTYLKDRGIENVMCLRGDPPLG